jgi:sialate O-acetylesterase
MKITSRVFLLMIVLSVFLSGKVNAKISMPAIFGDHMVLQQQSDADIWGKAAPNSQVRITTSWNKKNYTTRASGGGDWKIKVETPVAGGPYSITISDGQPVVLKDVLIGEVWVCSGQSNMEMPMKGFRNQPVTGSNEAIVTSANTSIRLFTVARDKSLTEKYDFKGNWTECAPEHVSEFSATAYFFGRMIQQALGVPVGLICSAWGGTRIEPWISESGFKSIEGIKLPDKSSTAEFTPQIPTVLFNAMIAPLVPYTLRGAIWYQGESNRNEADKYEELMTTLIQNWRDEWGNNDMSFYFTQIAPFDYGISGLNSALLREAQLKASNKLPGTGMACLMDAGEKDCIHPSNKKAAGERLAYLALAKTYGKKGFAAEGPVLKEMTVEGSLVKLAFDNAPMGLTSMGKELQNFRVAGENKRFYTANAQITGTGITLYCPQVQKPVAVRYAFDDFVIGDLYNIEGLPASSFRTDDWED